MSSISKTFDGEHAYKEYLQAQMSIGARPSGSAGNRATGEYILAQLQQSNWQSETQDFDYRNIPIRNIIGKQAIGRGPIILIGAHYDTRPRADQDKQNQNVPVLGANDGASGVAVLLEIARTLDVSKLHNEVWLVFFDAEDNGDLNACVLMQTPTCDQTKWPWSVGATYFADHLEAKLSAAIILDMIGDINQNIYYERNSDKELQAHIWNIAARLGYDKQFIPQYKWAMEDDHTPFLQRSIRAVDVIDFDYPYWHTTQDTSDKVSPDSLASVGKVMQAWLEQQ